MLFVMLVLPVDIVCVRCSSNDMIKIYHMMNHTVISRRHCARISHIIACHFVQPLAVWNSEQDSIFCVQPLAVWNSEQDSIFCVQPLAVWNCEQDSWSCLHMSPWCTRFQMYKISGVHDFRCTTKTWSRVAVAYKISGVQDFRCTRFQVYKISGVSAGL